jgi:hypothetical protein
MLEVTVVERFDLDRARLWAAHTDGPRADANRARTGDLCRYSVALLQEN